MTLISFPTLIRALSVFHITLAYFFLASPKTVAEQSMVFILGESMHLVGGPSGCFCRGD